MNYNELLKSIKVPADTCQYWDVRIEKEGCQPRIYTFARNEKLDVGALIGGIFLLVPFLWIMEYNPLHHYQYTCNKK